MATQTTMRIYVGGLGETVTEEDLQNTFSKLGVVEVVDIVRTKGRSFAYINFLPSSEKSLAKLFSTYNGCSWKGGKLKLEKAKEHYLERLKREWVEDAEFANKTYEDDTKSMVSSVGQEKALDCESTQIHMYFPKLRKVKSLLYKGTGKHKYSFQRVEAPALPVHFCDCVEHSDNIDTIKETKIHHANMEGGGMNQYEINMMNSILNKFLEREPYPAASYISSEVASQAEVTLSKHLPVQQNHEDDSTDDDNIIINAVAGPTDLSHLLENMKQKTGSYPKMARSENLQGSADVHSKNNIVIHKGKDKHSRKKSKLVQIEESDQELESSVPNRKQTHINSSEERLKSLSTKEESGSEQSIGNTLSQRGELVDRDGSLSLNLSLKPGGVSDNEAQPEAASLSDGDRHGASVHNLVNHVKEDPESRLPKQLNEVANTDPEHVNSEKPTKVSSWSQKSSWMQLVGSATNSLFSISQILPETKKSKQSKQNPSGQKIDISDTSNQSGLKRKRGKTDERLDSGKEEGQGATSEVPDVQRLNKKEQNLDIQRSETPKNLLENFSYANGKPHSSTSRNKSEEKKAFTLDFRVSETCPFMRTDSSMKEWMKAKATLSGSHKKKK